MRQTWIIILCAAGALIPQSRGLTVEKPRRNQPRKGKFDGTSIGCPDEFIRLNSYCFYFGTSEETWKRAHFQCEEKHENATLLTIPKRKGLERKLRNYLKSSTLARTARWIGVRYNIGNSDWEWSVPGIQLYYNRFIKGTVEKGRSYPWQCISLDPNRKYRWRPSSCVDKKQFICQLRIKGRNNSNKARRKNQNAKPAPITGDPDDNKITIPDHYNQWITQSKNKSRGTGKGRRNRKIGYGASSRGAVTIRQ